MTNPGSPAESHTASRTHALPVGSNGIEKCLLPNAGRSVAEMQGQWARPLDYLLAKQPHVFEEMRSRVIAVLLEIAAAHEGKRVLVVTHGGPIAAAWLACGGDPADRPSVANCHVQRIRVEGGRMTRLD